MRIEQIAKLIPDEYRREILELNMISNAKPQAGDPTMHYLAVVWKNYIEPTFVPDCPLCYATVLNNFKQMKKILVQLEMQAQLLKQA